MFTQLSSLNIFNAGQMLGILKFYSIVIKIIGYCFLLGRISAKLVSVRGVIRLQIAENGEEFQQN